MSPYLFTLVMELLTLILKRNVNSSDFEYHSKCDKMKIINLCFPDDLFMFASGKTSSVEVRTRSLDEFQRI